MKPRRTILCKRCLQQLHLPIPIHGALSIPFRIFGLRPSRMNPNLSNGALTRRLTGRHAFGAKVPEVCRGDRWRRRAQNLY
jgi:hypothetical protein